MPIQSTPVTTQSTVNLSDINIDSDLNLGGHKITNADIKDLYDVIRIDALTCLARSDKLDISFTEVSKSVTVNTSNSFRITTDMEIPVNTSHNAFFLSGYSYAPFGITSNDCKANAKISSTSYNNNFAISGSLLSSVARNSSPFAINGYPTYPPNTDYNYLNLSDSNYDCVMLTSKAGIFYAGLNAYSTNTATVSVNRVTSRFKRYLPNPFLTTTMPSGLTELTDIICKGTETIILNGDSTNLTFTGVAGVSLLGLKSSNNTICPDIDDITSVNTNGTTTFIFKK